MKKMKNRVLLFLGMGSCISAPVDQRSVNPDNSSLKTVKWSSVPAKTTDIPKEGGAITLKALVFDARGSKDEVFFDSKPWLESDDEDFLSVNGDYSPQHKQFSNNGDQQAGKKLAELFKDSHSFSSDSQTSQKANEEANGAEQKALSPKPEKKKTGKASQRCLPSLVRTLSCGERKKTLSPAHISVAG